MLLNKAKILENNISFAPVSTPRKTGNIIMCHLTEMICATTVTKFSDPEL